MDAVKILADAVKTIGRTLPVGMEVWFGRNDGDPHVHMEIGEEAGQKLTEYRFLNGEPLNGDLIKAICRESLLESALRDLGATIDLHTDCMTGLIERSALDSYIDAAETLLGEGWEPDTGHPANDVTRQPAIISHPVGSLGEPIEDQEWLG